MAINPKNQRFVLEYLVDLNATQAAIRAGYSEKTAGAIGHELLKKPEIVAAIEKEEADRAARLRIDADWVLTQAVKLHQRCMAVGEGFHPAGAARALEMAGKHVTVQAFSEKHDHNHSGELKITHERAIDALK